MAHTLMDSANRMLVGATPEQDEIAIQVLRQYLAGTPPLQHDHELLGPWAVDVKRIHKACKQGGHEAALKEIRVTLKANPLLASKLAPKGIKVGGLTLFSAADACQPLWMPPQRVSQIVPDGGVCMLVGDPGNGKTYSLIHLGLSVAAGLPWLGLPVEQCPVLFIDEESGSYRLRDRISKVLRGLGLPEDTPFFYTCMNSIDLRQPPDHRLESLKQVIRELGIRLMIIDALADVMLGGDENLVRDVQPVFHNARWLGEHTGAASLFIHHTNRDGKERGSSAIKGALDYMLQVNLDARSGLLTFKTLKARDSEPRTFAAQPIFGENSYQLVPVEDGLAPSTFHFTPAERCVVDYLTQHGASDVEHITSAASAAGLKPETVRQAICKLAKQGIVRRVDNGGPGTKATYELTELGKKLSL